MKKSPILFPILKKFTDFSILLSLFLVEQQSPSSYALVIGVAIDVVATVSVLFKWWK